MKTLYWILISTSLTSCFSKEKSRNSQSPDSVNTKLVIEKNELEDISSNQSTLINNKNEDSIIIEQRVLHKFSQVNEKDEFYICIKGKSIIEGKVVFKIISNGGIEILKEEFPAYLLMNYGFEGDLDSKKDREDYMKMRISKFFDEDNFISPAIEKDDVLDVEYSQEEIWNEIQSDQTAIGFYFLIGEEDGRSIAYSKKTEKVVMYYNCC